MWNQLRKIAELGNGFSGYNCTKWRNAEDILKNGFHASFYHLGQLSGGSYFTTHFWDFYEMLPNEAKSEELVKAVEDETSGGSEYEHNKALLLKDDWSKYFQDKATIIWLSNDIDDNALKRVEQFGDACLKVRLPEGSTFITDDGHYGSVYFVPMKRIPPEYFELVGEG